MFSSSILPTPPRALYTAALGLTSLTTTLLLLRHISLHAFKSPPSAAKQWIDGPRKTLLPHLSPQEQRKLAYPPDALPGARDVDTPFGSIRVYEWGPEDGEKVLFVHGISTPSIAFANLAPRLVDGGYRVMLFDLFGRGYTDAPLAPYSALLYTSQIHLVLASSPLPWLAPSSSFHILGYSLGGGLAANFAAHFPARVRSLVAIAPAGLLRYTAMSWRTRIFYAPAVQAVMPRSWRDGVVRRILWSVGGVEREEGGVVGADEVGMAAGTGDSDGEGGDTDDGVKTYEAGRTWTAAACNQAVNESLDTHAGLPMAFVSSLQHAPIYGQEDEWRRIGCRVLMILGARDPIIRLAEYGPRFERLFGEEQRRLVVLDAGHEVPISHGKECAEAILGFWKELE
ncbi:alpha/beta-hydrolase [Pseudovirgaria hyperparasitica]|uniref:Alpha/beta-hydrolase n=1 Tax=Pseudovirgaria hyperparasitica TaxID=470096 RepID=A0A6A6VZP0_9PEZI|nr:alpha/beta-hydrolase [Pseudovirgaria hyperparasitica]KAF2755214.1 alpha/beta-hydrolase [Pseudovirgaria hyperparasitica]